MSRDWTGCSMSRVPDSRKLNDAQIEEAIVRTLESKPPAATQTD